MVKTFLLEHVSAHGERAQKPVETIFRALGCELSRVDESFWVLRAPITHPGNQQPSLEVVGYLETYDKRFFAFYTAEKAGFARHLVNRWTTVSADLDATWFSSQLLQVLWQRDVQHRSCFVSGATKFTKLGKTLFARSPTNSTRAISEPERGSNPRLTIYANGAAFARGICALPHL